MIRPHLARASELGDVRRVAERLGARLMRSSRHEYVGPCPACGGNDRFGVNVIKNIWNCRQCAKGGDVIAARKNSNAIQCRSPCSWQLD